MQSPTLPILKTQPCPCHSAFMQPGRTTSPGHVCANRKHARGGTALAKHSSNLALSNAGSGEAANANSVSAAELRLPQSIEGYTAVSESVVDLLVQSAELLLILGVAGAQGCMLLIQWQQQQQQRRQQVHQEEARHSESMHRHQVLMNLCDDIKGAVFLMTSAVMTPTLCICFTGSTICTSVR